VVRTAADALTRYGFSMHRVVKAWGKPLKDVLAR
jgi:hypothetical protein